MENALKTIAAASLLIASMAFLRGTSAVAEPDQGSKQPEQSGIEQSIHDYVLAHPEVIIESLRRAKQKEQDQIAANAKSTIMSLTKELLEDPNSPVLGNPKGDVTIVEFFDYRCPYCRQIEPWLRALIKDDPGVRLVQKEFPILGPASVFAASAALAALKQGRYAEFHNAMMAKKPNLEDRAVLEIAKEVGLDIERLTADMKSQDVNTELQRNIEIAKALNITGTPALIVGTELIPGATDLGTLKSMVNDTRRARD